MKRLILALSLMIGAQAQADVLFEPYLGYHSLTSTLKTSLGSDDDKVTGVTLGARLGYETMGFSVGLDYMTAMWKDDGDPASDITPADLGIFAAYEFPILLRVYGVYVPTSKAKSKDNTGSVDLEGKGGIKIGVGYTGFPVIAINVEMLQTTFDKMDGTAIPFSGKLESKGFGLVISAPLTF